MSRNSPIVRGVLAAALLGGALAAATRACGLDSKTLQMLVDRLADSGNGFDTPEAVAASHLLVKFGTKAFPILIENLGDERPACKCFQGDTAGIATVGDACRNIIQGQVERYTYLGKAFPRYLDRNDLKKWWRENNQKELLQLQIEAIEWTVAEIGTNNAYESLRNSLPKLKRSLKALYAEQTFEKLNEAEGPVPLQDVQKNGIEGRLGVRLGTIVVVTGTVVKNSSRNKRDADIPFFLNITSVDGRELPKPVIYPFSKANRGVKMSDPQIDDNFRYVGYETGAYYGSPKGEFDYVPPYATTGFAFQTSFSVLAAK